MVQRKQGASAQQERRREKKALNTAWKTALKLPSLAATGIEKWLKIVKTKAANLRKKTHGRARNEFKRRMETHIRNRDVLFKNAKVRSDTEKLPHHC